MNGPPCQSVERGTIAISFVHEALACLRARGLNSEPLLAQAGISPELLLSPQARVSAERYGLLWRLIAQATDDEFFGMDSRRMKAGSFTLLCHAVVQADTLGRALRRALRFFRVILDDLTGELVREGPLARLVLTDTGPGTSGAALPPPKRAFAYGTYFLMLYGLACWLVGRRIPILVADFRCSEPSFSAEWRVLFSPQLKFDRPWTGIAFDADYLDMANIQNERTLQDFLRGAPANLLVKYKNSASVAARIRHRLRETPPAVWPDFATLAWEFHASPSTLRRHLDQEGQSYRAILEDLRRDLAISMLSHSDRSILDIATDLGFAEASAFHRAFKKWTGIRPGEYRVGAVPPA